MDEFALIEQIKKKVPRTRYAALGIGDDAAVLKAVRGGDLVVSTDMLVEGVDFILKKLSSEKIGRKALAVNLSDLAAMGAEPLAFVISIGKPRHASAQWVLRFYDGLLTLAREFRVDCIGGDLSGARELSVSITVFGKTRRPVTRGGAEPGDWIAVTGRLGGSILRHHCDFTPRVREGIFLAKKSAATAMIDISDGLCQDLTHILRASGVGAALDLERIPISADAKKLSCGNKAKALGRALSDGEDFELLFTVPPRCKLALEPEWRRRFPKVPLTWIGRIERETPRIRWMLHGKLVPAPKFLKKGFGHFR